jgi:hypothetical protein
MWWRRPEPILDRETVDGITKLMEIDAKPDDVLDRLELIGDDEEDDDDA